MSYTNGLDKPSDYFDTKLYAGNGSSQSISGLDFQPDWVWIKARTIDFSHSLFDSVRGVQKRLQTNNTEAEGTDTQSVTAFNSDGFSIGNSSSVNENSNNFVVWNWLAGDSNTSVSASGSGNGAINACTYRANTTSGFSIVEYTGRNGDISNNNETKVAHGLGVKPYFVFIKRIDSAEDWVVRGGNSVSDPLTNDYHLKLNTSDARSGSLYIGKSYLDDSTHFLVGNDAKVNQQDATYIAYAFAEKKGFSKMGSYVGNGSTDGTFVYTGFSPSFVIRKRTDSADSWQMHDNKRDTFNVTYHRLLADDSGSEYTSTSNQLDFLSNGFKCRASNGGANGSGGTYIYMCFAENPFVTSTGIPTTAR